MVGRNALIGRPLGARSCRREATPDVREHPLRGERASKAREQVIEIQVIVTPFVPNMPKRVPWIAGLANLLWVSVKRRAGVVTRKDTIAGGTYLHVDLYGV